MKFGLLNVLALVSVVPLAVALNACGDDSSTSGSSDGGNRGGIPDTVQTMNELLSDIPCGKSQKCVATYLVEYHGKAVCDGEDGWVFGSLIEKMDCDFTESSDEGDDENSPDSENSSSSAKSSSSSVKSSSSFTSSSSTKPENPASSSSAKSSSNSSKPLSSSSEYVPFDHSQTLGSIGQEGVYKTFTDSRNGRSYYYMEFKGVNRQGDSATVTAMAENLNIGEMVAGDKDQADDSKVERYCYDNDTINCDRYGGLYQWAEMMKLPSECNTKSCADSIKPNHQGICPDDWRLLTYDDFVVILNSNGNNHGIEGVRSTFGFGGYNTTGYSLVGAGLRRPTGEFKDCLGKETYWYYPGEILVDGEMFVLGSNTSYRDNSIYGPSNFNYTKLEGRSVRCVKSK
uniref:FISUMP domain-containing protein n=2 Tax=uncultured Fibrobacter sp. TaxID=261512 RepID=UPI00260FE2EE|nr:FISUMP domain-containing protein [uncultured Fibrobacter sp.]